MNYNFSLQDTATPPKVLSMCHQADPLLAASVPQDMVHFLRWLLDPNMERNLYSEFEAKPWHPSSKCEKVDCPSLALQCLRTWCTFWGGYWILTWKGIYIQSSRQNLGIQAQNGKRWTVHPWHLIVWHYSLPQKKVCTFVQPSTQNWGGQIMGIFETPLGVT